MVVDGHAYLEMVGADSLGARAGLDVLFFPDVDHRLSLRAGYRRVVERDNGYHATHATLRWRLALPLALLVDDYVYRYDQPILGNTTSTVQDATLEWTPAAPWRVLVGSSIFSSPYARLDAQAVLRVSYTLGPGGGQL